MSSTKQQPFKIRYDTSVAPLLEALGCTLALSTYQAGKLLFISPQPEGRLIQLPRSFVRPMGIALRNDKLAIACKEEVLVLRNSPQLAWHYPKKPKTYDALYMPRSTYHTGELDVHDLDFVGDELVAVNTNFSCLIKIDENYSFTPIWKPDFITTVTSGDHCHLNGMAVDQGEIKYVSAFAPTDSPRAWTAALMESGIVIDYATKAIVLDGLAMPHSPRIYDNHLYLLLSGTGELIKVDMESYNRETVFQTPGFMRGLAIYEGYAFIGLSKVRKESSSFGKLKIADSSSTAGVIIVELATGKLIGRIQYEQSVDEIYDVQILPGMKRPSILNTRDDVYKQGLTLPERTFWGAKREKA